MWRAILTVILGGIGWSFTHAHHAGITLMLTIDNVSTVSESCSPRPLRAFGSAMLIIGAVLGAFATPFAGQCVFADSVEPGTVEAELETSALCNPEDTVIFAPQAPSTSERPCPAHTREAGETARARTYLIATATPGYTMTRQGPERAIERLHPEFVNRLAAAIAEARRAAYPKILHINLVWPMGPFGRTIAALRADAGTRNKMCHFPP
jgi:hypothetical protein